MEKGLTSLAKESDRGTLRVLRRRPRPGRASSQASLFEQTHTSTRSQCIEQRIGSNRAKMAACAAASRSAIAIHAASQPRAHPARLQIKLRPQLRVVTCDQAGAAAPAHPRWADWRQHLLTPPLQSGASAPWRQATLASSYRPRRDLERIWEASSSQKHEHTGGPPQQGEASRHDYLAARSLGCYSTAATLSYCRQRHWRGGPWRPT